LKPRDEIHQTYIDVEPFTGDPLRLAERLQLVLKVDNWDLPSVRLYEYFHWDTEKEKKVVTEGLETAYIAIRDATTKVIVNKIEDKIDEFCTASQEKHFKHCEKMVTKIEELIYHELLIWCTGTGGPSAIPIPSPTSVPLSLPTSAPTSVPIPTPTSVPITKPTSVPISWPTSSPSFSPTSIPSSSPSFLPTSVPHSVPTSAPTSKPTSAPHPIPAPTSVPISVPTLVPISAPTSAPHRRNMLSFETEMLSLQNQDMTIIDHGNGALPFPIPTLPPFNETGKELICTVIDYTYENIIEPHKIAGLIEKAREWCLANAGSCASFETLIRQKIEDFISSKCDDPNIDPKTQKECKLGMIAAKAATSVFDITSNFCHGGVCELITKVKEFVNGTSLVLAKNKECEKLKDNRNKHCGLLNNYTQELISKECINNINWTIPGKTITAKHICEMVDKLVYHNEFDDNVINYTTADDKQWQWNDDFLTLPHGVFWKKANSYCSCEGSHGFACKIQQSTCSGAAAEAQKEIDKVCPDKPAACAGGKFIIENWETVDGIINRTTNTWHRMCETDPCTHLGLEPNEPIQTLVTKELLSFCNVSMFISDDGAPLPPYTPYSERPWLNLAKACPTIVHKVQTIVEDYCTEDTVHGIECNIIKSIPWSTPITEEGGPILSFIEDVAIPKINHLRSNISAWCEAQGDNLPDIHKDICEALEPLIVEEFEAVFNEAVLALDHMVPQFNISGVVTTAEEYMTCALGEATSPGIGSEGYYFPLCWADEWMDVPHEDTRLIKDDVYATQNIAQSIKISFLCIAGVFGALACLVVIVRNFTKGDYESEDRLLNRELVALKGDVTDPFSDPYETLANLDLETEEDIKNPLQSSSSITSTVKSGNAWV